MAIQYKAQTDWWENVKSPSWIVTPFLGWLRCQSACYNKSKMGLYVRFGWEMAVWEPKEKKQSLMAPSLFNQPFLSLEKKNLLRYFFYRIFLSNPKFQLICIQFDLAMENLCLAAILIFSAILFFFCSNLFFLFFVMILTSKMYH
jgi:hypothetical protein